MASEAPTILIVDDEPRQRKVLTEFLGGRGYSVVEAPDAETGLERAAAETPELVLMDVRMPGMGGLKGLALMRERHPTLPVILLTAYADVRDGDLYFSVTMPNLIVGTVGNGKHLPFVRDVMTRLGCDVCREPGENARRLAVICAAAVWCGELSLMAAQTNPGELMQAHRAIERNK